MIRVVRCFVVGFRVEELENENQELRNRRVDPPLSAAAPAFDPATSTSTSTPIRGVPASMNPLAGDSVRRRPIHFADGTAPQAPRPHGYVDATTSQAPRPHGYADATTSQAPRPHGSADATASHPRPHGWSDLPSAAGNLRARSGTYAAPGSGMFERNEDRHRPAARNTMSKTIAESAKVIKVKLNYTTDIVAFLTVLSDLENEIETVYHEETELVKCKVGLNLMGEKVRGEAKNIFLRFQALGVYDFGQMMRDTFRLLFPASKTALKNSFDSLTQTHPHKITISEFAGRLRTMSRLLEYNIEDQTKKFMNGLANQQIRLALKTNKLIDCGFEETVAMAVEIEYNFADEKQTSVRHLVEPEIEEDPERAMKVMGVAWGVYLDEARKKGVGNKCFNCFSDNHQAGECRLRSCKFCDGEVRKVQHYSLLCKKAPKNLEKFLDARRTYKNKVDAARIADDFTDFNFEEDDFSD